MAGLLERVGTLISANINWLVSSALKANSMAVVDEYIRRVEDNLEALEDAAATVGGEAKTLRRKYDDFDAQVDALDKNIDLLLREGKDSLAVAAQSRYNTLARLADTYQEQALHQEAEFQKLLDAKLKRHAIFRSFTTSSVSPKSRKKLRKIYEMDCDIMIPCLQAADFYKLFFIHSWEPVD